MNRETAKAVLLGAALFVVLMVIDVASAQQSKLPTYRDNYTTIQLHPGECKLPDEVRKIGEDPKLYREFQMSYKGIGYEGCWALLLSGDVCLVTVDFGHGDIPAALFSVEEHVQR